MPQDWPRLAAYVETRRQDMGAPPKSSIINPNTYRRLMRGEALTEASLRTIETAIGWETRSADHVLAGGEPRLKPAAATARGGREAARHLDDPRPDDVVAAVYVTADGRAFAAVAGDTEEEREQILRILARGRSRRLGRENDRPPQRPDNG